MQVFTALVEMLKFPVQLGLIRLEQVQPHQLNVSTALQAFHANFLAIPIQVLCALQAIFAQVLLSLQFQLTLVQVKCALLVIYAQQAYHNNQLAQLVVIALSMLVFLSQIFVKLAIIVQLVQK